MTDANFTWGIAGAATLGVILRPWHVPEAVWAVSGATLLVLFGLLPMHDAWRGILRGTDVYLFLAGMMLLAELARQEGLFDVLAAHAARLARGSGARLFTLIYLVGTVVTVFLSNDATAVVLTPAVAAVARTAQAAEKLPYLLVCAFVANAASFVLPISNPANLVIYGSHMPPLLEWVPRFALPASLSILATYVMLRLTQRHALRQEIATEVAVPSLAGGGGLAAAGIAATAIVLMVASWRGWQLGLPTFLAGLATVAAVRIHAPCNLLPMLRRVSWGILPLVAGLFMLVEGLERTGLVHELGTLLQRQIAHSDTRTAWGSGVFMAIICNLMNNLPAGLIAGTTVQATDAPNLVSGAVLIGVDLGPNLSVTGSLATILWLATLRREDLQIGAGTFLRLGFLVMPPALLLSLGALLLAG